MLFGGRHNSSHDRNQPTECVYNPQGEHHNRVVVVDQTPFPQGGGAARAAVEAENIIRGLRSELAAMQAQHATAMAEQAEELEQLRAAVSTSLDLQNLTEELANLRHHSDALRRDVRQARALAQETEEQKSAVEKRAQTLMSTLDEKRSEQVSEAGAHTIGITRSQPHLTRPPCPYQAKLQRLVDRATRRMANRSDQLATVVARYCNTYPFAHRPRAHPPHPGCSQDDWHGCSIASQAQ